MWVPKKWLILTVVILVLSGSFLLIHATSVSQVQAQESVVFDLGAIGTGHDVYRVTDQGNTCYVVVSNGLEQHPATIDCIGK
jgi:hypothetical protein